MRCSLLSITLGCLLGLLPIARGAQPAAPVAELPASVDTAAAQRALIEADWIDQDRRYRPGQSLKAVPPQELPGGKSTGKSAAPPSGQALPPLPERVTTAEDAAGGCDGIKNGFWGFHVASGEQDPWWQVDLGQEYRLDRVVIYNRCDRPTRTRNLRVLVAGSDGDPACKEFRQVHQHAGTAFFGFTDDKPLVVDLKAQGGHRPDRASAGPRAVLVRLGRGRSLRGGRAGQEHRLEEAGRPDQRQPAFLSRHASGRSLRPAV